MAAKERPGKKETRTLIQRSRKRDPRTSPFLAFAHSPAASPRRPLPSRSPRSPHFFPLGLLDFDNRQRWLQQQLDALRAHWHTLQPLQVQRQDVFRSVVSRVAAAGPRALTGRLSVTFSGEAGICLGPMREFFALVGAHACGPGHLLLAVGGNGTLQLQSHLYARDIPLSAAGRPVTARGHSARLGLGLDGAPLGLGLGVQALSAETALDEAHADQEAALATDVALRCDALQELRVLGMVLGVALLQKAQVELTLPPFVLELLLRPESQPHFPGDLEPVDGDLVRNLLWLRENTAEVCYCGHIGSGVWVLLHKIK